LNELQQSGEYQILNVLIWSLFMLATFPNTQRYCMCNGSNTYNPYMHGSSRDEEVSKINTNKFTEKQIAFHCEVDKGEPSAA
jgi:hypothetical protein